MLYKLHFEYKIILLTLIFTFINLIISFTEDSANYGYTTTLSNTTYLEHKSLARFWPQTPAKASLSLTHYNSHSAGNALAKGSTVNSRHGSPAKATLHTTTSDDLPLL